MSEKLILYVDGGCSGNGQKDLTKRKMVSVVTRKNGKLLSELNMTGGSNNIAELIAVQDALRWCVWRDVKEVEIRTDSRNNLAWVNGTKVGKKINDREHVLNLKEAINTLREDVKLTLVWVPRDENRAGHYIENNYGV